MHFKFIVNQNKIRRFNDGKMKNEFIEYLFLFINKRIDIFQYYTPKTCNDKFEITRTATIAILIYRHKIKQKKTF